LIESERIYQLSLAHQLLALLDELRLFLLTAGCLREQCKRDQYDGEGGQSRVNYGFHDGDYLTNPT
jgi:hypothetical protein